MKIKELMPKVFIVKFALSIIGSLIGLVLMAVLMFTFKGKADAHHERFEAIASENQAKADEWRKEAEERRSQYNEQYDDYVYARSGVEQAVQDIFESVYGTSTEE